MISQCRVISDADNQASSVKLFNRLQWLPFYEEPKIAKCCVAYKRIKGEVPLYTENSLILNSQQHNRASRFNRMTEGGRSFAVTTCQLWNSLSLKLRNYVSLESFKNSYRNNLFDVQRKLYHFNSLFILIHYLLSSYVLILFIICLLIEIVMLEKNLTYIVLLALTSVLCTLSIILHQFCKTFLYRGPQVY